jgi:hypothetical protein
MRRGWLIGAFLVTAACVPLNGDPSPSDQREGVEDTPEYKLAVIDEGGYVDPADPVVDRFARVLDKLQRKCSDSRSFVGDMAVRSQELMAEEGVRESLLSILTNVNRSIPRKLGRSCSDIFATYVVLRTG